MKIIGVTGKSGAGKTTICKILKEKYNANIIDADEIARDLSKKGNKYLQAIANCFGEDILNASGELQRKKLANIIYESEEKRNDLNNITFIYVVEEMKEKISGLKNEKLVVIDAPLLFESGLDKMCDFVIGVTASKAQKIERICKRDNITEEIAQKRLEIQMEEDEIRKRADYVIENENDLQILEKEIEKIEDKLI
ncbi:MAG: dephospho-CoA kinase [Clostridia bacterium]|nr:dephospho-CoA kinase [Clostridia bacterium]